MNSAVALCDKDEVLRQLLCEFNVMPLTCITAVWALSPCVIVKNGIPNAESRIGEAFCSTDHLLYAQLYQCSTHGRSGDNYITLLFTVCCSSARNPKTMYFFSDVYNPKWKAKRPSPEILKFTASWHSLNLFF